MTDSLDCVIALAFGYRMSHGKTLPGRSNEDLAKIVHEKYGHLPKILQEEVADAFRTLDVEPVMRIESMDSETYLDTYQVLRQALEICQKSNWKHPAFIAHPLHIPRIIKVATKLGFVVDAKQIEDLRNDVISYDPQSEQPWTRSGLAMRVHENIANAIYKGRRYI